MEASNENTGSKGLFRRFFYLPMARFLGWLCSWRNLVRGLFLIACIATLLAGFYAEENWRGKKAWENYRKTLAATGAVLDWEAFIPPPVPEDQNKFKAPGMMDWFVKKGPNLPPRSPNLGTPGAFLQRNHSNTGAVRIAELIMAPADTTLDPGETNLILQLHHPAAGEQARQILRKAIGATAEGSQGFTFAAEGWRHIKSVRVSVVADELPALNDFGDLFPSNALTSPHPASSRLRVESAGSNKFRVMLSPPPPSAADYLGWSDQFAGDLNLIGKALKRPYARMDGDYARPVASPVPNFVTIRRVAQMLADRAICHLLLSQPEEAMSELTSLHDLLGLLEGKPTTLVAAMINVAVTGLYLDIVADGLRLGAWLEPQLVAIESQVEKINLPPIYVQSLAAERAGLCRALGTAMAEDNFLINSLAGQLTLRQRLKEPAFLFFSFAPRGWRYQNMIRVARAHQLAIDSFDLTNGLVLPQTTAQVGQELVTRFSRHSPYVVLARLALPNLTKATQTVARNQTMANQALIACALERFRRARGQYPESLENLVPQFLEKIPHDLIGGQPLKYRRIGHGEFLLYSVGWNEIDDGGIPGLTKAGTEDREKGDWVWANSRKGS
jgi:hypothetical protein